MTGAPVFVLCSGRSGSTLLRFLLDAHPELGCPPENRMPALCSQLARVWSAVVGLPLSHKSGITPSEVPETAVAGVRQCMDLMVGAYLARVGKKRYCDKDLGTAQHAELLLRVYPDAKFLCLYRHPMDVIASGIEACPWGLHSHGFEPYVAADPGNSVHALARYWADHADAILAIEEKFPKRCHRIRYEDLVTDPETVAAGVFTFLGVAPVPGISTRCFSLDRERGGASDYKIWSTSRISADSVGRGWLVPANLIHAPVMARINALAAKLGYVGMDDNWGVRNRPADLRVDVDTRKDAAVPGTEGQPAPVPPGVAMLAERLQGGLSRFDEQFTRRWKPHSQEVFQVVATTPTGASVWWRVDPMAGAGTGGASATPTQSRHRAEAADWTITAPAEAWDQVIRNGINLGVAFRRCGMRYTDNGDGGAGSVIADTRLAMLAELLGIASWGEG